MVCSALGALTHSLTHSLTHCPLVKLHPSAHQSVLSDLRCERWMCGSGLDSRLSPLGWLGPVPKLRPPYPQDPLPNASSNLSTHPNQFMRTPNLRSPIFQKNLQWWKKN
ncbi:hypothetical protein M758_11G167100 [Ceratodon purpureus]|nr:hypothetical protein M758_11G167100 [Ceratodon purpureus]